MYMMIVEAGSNDRSINRAVRRVRHGDTAAFESIVRRFEQPLRVWIAVHAPPGIDVDDVAQQAFISAFSRLDEYQLDTNFGAWLFTIARYQLKTETTRLRRVADYHTRYAPELLQRELERRSDQSAGFDPSRLDHLKACLDSVAEHLRRFIIWRYEEEIPLSEMAARSGRSIASVKKQLWRLRRQLQDCMEMRMAAEGDST